MVAPSTSDSMSHDQASDFGANDWLIDELRETYEKNPDELDPSWRTYFDRESNHQSAPASVSPEPTAAAQTKPAQTKPAPNGQAPVKATAETPQPDPSRPTPGQSPEAIPADPKPAPNAANSPRKVPENRPNRPSVPGASGGLSADAPNPTRRPTVESAAPVTTVMKGAPMRTAKNMDSSLTMPTATSVRSVPMKLVIDQRTMINNFLRRSKGGKVSFTHLIGYAMVQALKAVPAMNNAYAEVDGKPALVTNPSINLGLAIDVAKKDGTRQLLVPNIKNCESLDFNQFWGAYEEVVAKARRGELTVDDFAGTTASLTNPGGIGTNHSVPRLMNGQGTILGVGSIDYPPEFQGNSESRLNDLGIGKLTTLTSTYDHRVIQGAQSGEFLKKLHELLIGQDGFYDDIFKALRIPYAPLRWANDISGHRTNQVAKAARVVELIQAYRSLGHLAADIDPLEYRVGSHPDLQLETHGLTIWDLDREFAVGRFGGNRRAYLTLREILDILRDSYCHTLGVEYMHITDPDQRTWFQERMEKPHVALPRDEHLRILDKLNEAEIFETFLQTKFVGQKRFSLEGGESAIVALDEICEQAANDNLDEVCIGMPHRGRLNVLANIIGKKYGQIFAEFDGNMDPRNSQGTGDVKYHLGAEGQFTALSGATVKASVAANPSHLEAVNPVLEGIARAKLDRLRSSGGVYPVVPILMHGDASFAGQGVVYETLQMSQLRGYKTGGTIHLVVNNQVGFTTSPSESRTSVYCTDVAKVIEAPVFHVNGDDPDACVEASRMAYEFRQKFNKDVVIDLICYRRRGHNEGDDPSFTQPRMYDLIEQKRSTRKLYTESLIGRGDISVADAEEVMDRFRSRLENVFKEVREAAPDADEYKKVPVYPVKPGGFKGTATTPDVLAKVAEVHSSFPDGFTVHPKVLPQLERRAKAIMEGPIDWATAELLAFGSLLLEGRPVRLTGQDSRRGTFVQRFAAIVDRHTNDSWVPLKHLSEDQATFEVFDSLLSEYAVMGFEYGYSVAAPEALVLWEAQFGDFANGAQTIADEFISSGAAKWTQKSGVVLLLPHGHDGQGPDHSSARIERWLQLCSEGALAVCQPSTPASHFHLLRQHAYVNWHRPVVIATPKSMLRNKLSTSMPEEFTTGTWQPALDDPTITDPASVRTVLLCSGKIRWDLVAERKRRGLEGQVAIVSLERLYPLPDEALAAILGRYRHVDDVRFVQDEPENQGAYEFMKLHLPAAVARHMSNYELSFTGITRPPASAPSVGLSKVHQAQEAELLQRAFDAVEG
ncbi:multifunctional oxoglutarate decarboxylase/oxoglutarate dehydrogenase thiamine pyrophosphate-binding subunit/dihydrolipoyllysine-residue succinyltransferase subunit [Aestuariimicrobium sp. T2.26MG-19.2B]|uniref:multifunctional oxoglutarate decarboxylase/oxoglutarate dehydrogenase thiamine pyrophosphate-binding subunit/dihydrolipoyllysine-residue succinyltransferase subunit n=1 Tax=Aestuariimicrobium sp. T2.26MG-19.2B TaxID=3040679 RepID=UPI002477963B|nr:multifunctional oxoglutarate decarboxylase/oxoglutarate dehydrogenase thiamine pyrophosphate-binding subunit/dihydrolipoyllysine-residue succinyltransferase subunit [Aestuariimicrobium sp. T2.26MG-19.2B]CAI9410494.1 Multifunctional 2-oxoglutarate metabolism enzyme [Aestuariimicrobium sp. T2.26MG-19.2B]